MVNKLTKYSCQAYTSYENLRINLEPIISISFQMLPLIKSCSFWENPNLSPTCTPWSINYSVIWKLDYPLEREASKETEY